MSVSICLFRHTDAEGNPYYIGNNDNNPSVILDDSAVLFVKQKKDKNDKPYLVLSIVRKIEKPKKSADPDPDPDPDEVPF